MPQKDVESCALRAKIQAFQSICVLSVTIASPPPRLRPRSLLVSDAKATLGTQWQIQRLKTENTPAVDSPAPLDNAQFSNEFQPKVASCSPRVRKILSE